MAQQLFIEWFHEQFVPSVKTFLKQKNLPQKALLILDNCLGYPDRDEMKSGDGLLKVIFHTNC